MAHSGWAGAGSSGSEAHYFLQILVKRLASRFVEAVRTGAGSLAEAETKANQKGLALVSPGLLVGAFVLVVAAFCVLVVALFCLLREFRL